MKKNRKILIDSIAILSPLTGIGKYTYENAVRMKDEQGYDFFYNYGYHSDKLYGPAQDDRADILRQLKSLIVKNPFAKKISREILRTYSRFISTKYDLYWQPNFIPDLNINADKVVSTVHDFSFYLQPEWHPKERLDYQNKYFFENVVRSDWLITGSEYTKQEIIDILKFPKEKITVINHGVDHQLYRVYEDVLLEKTRLRLALNDTFLLFVGSIEPRKNLVNLLKAYHGLTPEEKSAFPLVLVGFKGWENKEIMKVIEQEREHITYLGYLSDEELAHVYNLATLFIYPSLYEGFGIPPLEAMACATAVIASNVASLPEACGDAVEYVDPLDVDMLTKSISSLLSDPSRREELIDKGLEHVKAFSWDKAAQSHLNVFEKVMSL